MNDIQVSVIIVSYNVRSFLELCLDSVTRALSNTPSEIFVVDNASADGSTEMVQKRYPNVHLIASKENLGFSKGNNLAVNIAKGKYIHFLNPDTVIPEDFYEKTLAFMDNHPDAGCLGPKLLDGKGQFSMDSKKAFPSFWVSVYKVTGLSKLFSKSPKFNKYYRSDIPENQTAEVEILSGSCLLIRKEAMDKAGGSFDEDYFMYGEDVDLCYRIHNAGFKNYYYPEVAIIHYKGESTRKLSRQYMKIFFDAHVRLVKKYYPKRAAAFYISALRIVLALRNFFYVTRHFFALFKLFLFDIILLTISTIFIKNLWFANIAADKSLPIKDFIPLLSFLLFSWLISLFLSGAYDKPFSLYKAGRGMISGTIVALAGYALFPLYLRPSRAVVLLSGLIGFLIILFFRWLFGLIGWIKLVPRGNVNYKAAIVSNKSIYEKTLKVLANRNYYAGVLGRISPDNETLTEKDIHVLGKEKDILSIQKQYRIDEFVFSGASLSYKNILEWMQQCSEFAHFKIMPTQSLTFTGSSSHKSNAEIYYTHRQYSLGNPSEKRNKRIMDVLLSSLFIILFPFLYRFINEPKSFWKNILSVLKGKKTWVGYQLSGRKADTLPKIKKPVLPSYKIIENYEPDEQNKLHLAQLYATDYSIINDLQAILNNFKYLGRQE